MSKRKGFKIGILFTSMLLFLLFFMNPHVLASDTKYVTEVVPYDIVVPSTVINNVVESLRNTTRNYNDGSYQGTLSFVSISEWSEKLEVVYPDASHYRYTFKITYGGYVTRYAPADTKEVTVTIPYEISVPNTVINNVLKSFETSTYQYNSDGYSGTLSFLRLDGLTQTFVASYPGYSLYRYKFNVTYSGTVTRN